ncbi:DNA-binding transcriptional regulator, LysR family [Arboricoccus pini]|uniref:DNA-binding transcriptional regulator, LysR family n=1 Tax=Arboricoccus pini TaxID=1963835 RepID=A0A212RYL1_9PROT|nr:LysR family transcriptional regulator [Arboricoccus pini]SNB77758.1 DNA-binding transcriptional regulator, LysR family [Arboricoccus pini]
MRHLRVLHYLCEIARTQSIRQAALNLNLTPSAMNRRVQDLEAEIGADLFERHSRGVRPTEAGLTFLRYARGQLAEAERLRATIDALAGLRRGPVRIACSQAVAHEFLPMSTARFRAQHPGLSFEVEVSAHDRALAALSDYEADLALVVKEGMVPAFRILAVLPQRLVAILRADHPLASQSEVSLKACADYPLALPSAGMGTRRLIDDAATRMELDLCVAQVSNSFEMLRATVRHENLVSFQIEIGQPAKEEQSLVARPLASGEVPLAELVLCQLRARELPLAARAFALALAAELAAPKASA